MFRPSKVIIKLISEHLHSWQSQPAAAAVLYIFNCSNIRMWMNFQGRNM